LTNTRRLGRYPNLSNGNNDNSSGSASHFNELAWFYKESNSKELPNWKWHLFGHKRTPLQKVLVNAKKRIEKSTKFINKVKARDLACVGRLKTIPENATIRKEYIKCRKINCSHDRHGPYYYAYWKDPESKKLKKKYIGNHVPKDKELLH
jgi:hypothetical protein